MNTIKKYNRICGRRNTWLARADAANPILRTRTTTVECLENFNWVQARADDWDRLCRLAAIRAARDL